MSTRSLIGIENTDKTISYIYCHWDGYLGHVGKILTEHYTDEKVVKQLLDLGDLSSLGKTPVSNPEVWKNWKNFNSDPEHILCISYRDRGEVDVDFNTVNSLDDYIKAGNKSAIDYIYVFTLDHIWKYTQIEFGEEPKCVNIN